MIARSQAGSLGVGKFGNGALESDQLSAVAIDFNCSDGLIFGNILAKHVLGRQSPLNLARQFAVRTRRSLQAGNGSGREFIFNNVQLCEINRAFVTLGVKIENEVIIAILSRSENIPISRISGILIGREIVNNA